MAIYNAMTEIMVETISSRQPKRAYHGFCGVSGVFIGFSY
jgi:hypothetical protein